MVLENICVAWLWLFEAMAYFQCPSNLARHMTIVGEFRALTGNKQGAKKSQVERVARGAKESSH